MIETTGAGINVIVDGEDVAVLPLLVDFGASCCNMVYCGAVEYTLDNTDGDGIAVKYFSIKPNVAPNNVDKKWSLLLLPTASRVVEMVYAIDKIDTANSARVWLIVFFTMVK